MRPPTGTAPCIFRTFRSNLAECRRKVVTANSQLQTIELLAALFEDTWLVPKIETFDAPASLSFAMMKLGRGRSCWFADFSIPILASGGRYAALLGDGLRLYAGVLLIGSHLRRTRWIYERPLHMIKNAILVNQKFFLMP